MTSRNNNSQEIYIYIYREKKKKIEGAKTPNNIQRTVHNNFLDFKSTLLTRNSRTQKFKKKKKSDVENKKNTTTRSLFILIPHSNWT